MNQYLLEAAAALGLTASVLASLTTWLLATDPVTVSEAVSTRDAEMLLRVFATAVIDILRMLAGWL